MHNANELQGAIDNAITEVSRIGRKAHAAGDPQVAGLAFTASELLREVLENVDSLAATQEAATRVPFDKPKEQKTRKPRAAKAAPKAEPAAEPRQTAIANGHTAAGAE